MAGNTLGHHFWQSKCRALGKCCWNKTSTSQVSSSLMHSWMANWQTDDPLLWRVSPPLIVENGYKLPDQGSFTPRADEQCASGSIEDEVRRAREDLTSAVMPAAEPVRCTLIATQFCHGTHRMTLKLLKWSVKDDCSDVPLSS